MSSSKLVAVLLGAALAGCNDTTCGTGTIDDNGTCTPADETVGNAGCGSGTVLEGDQCVATNPPTECDPATTIPMTDPVTGVVTCVGNGVGGCDATFACPSPTSGDQTICGQLYDFEDDSMLQTANPSGAQCGSGSDMTGPCALQILPFDAVAFASNPGSATPLSSDPIYIDDCGRYRVPNIQLPGPSTIYVALGIDDADMPFGPSGTTVTTGVALPAESGTFPNFEAFTVNETVAGGWYESWVESGGSGSGGPNLADGLYAAIFRAHVCAASDEMCTGSAADTQSGVMFTAGGGGDEANSFYFADGANHDAIDATAAATTSNGTVLVTGASVTNGPIYSGTGGITDTTDCAWQTAAGASLPGIVLFQIYRPVSAGLGLTCSQ